MRDTRISSSMLRRRGNSNSNSNSNTRGAITIAEAEHQHQHQHPMIEDEVSEENDIDPSSSSSSSSIRSRSLQMLEQDQTGDNQFECQSLDIVDACRGMSASYLYRGSFVPYDGPCDGGGKILDGYPIYKTVGNGGPNEVPKFMYALSVYPDNWSVKELQGLVRWRVVDFSNFRDQTSCRTESANINSIDFAADGQPYNYWPTIYCFDEDGGEMDGFKSSTINIRCNDQSPRGNSAGGSGGTGTGAGAGTGTGIPSGTTPTVGGLRDDSKTALFLGIILILSAVSFGAYVVYNRCFKHKHKNHKHKHKKRYSEDNSKTKTDSYSRIPKKSTGEITDSDDSDLGGQSLGNDNESSTSFWKEKRQRPVSEHLQRRPFSTNSIMVDVDDSSHHSAGSEGMMRPASMHTVSKPYELVARRITKEAPEPPKIYSPLPLSAPKSKSKSKVFDNTVPRNLYTTIDDDDDNYETGRNRNVTNPQDDHDHNYNYNSRQNNQEQSRQQRHQPQPQPQPQRQQRYSSEESPQPQDRERGQNFPSEISEKGSFSDDSTFMSESLANMFKNVGQSLDQVISSDEEKEDNRPINSDIGKRETTEQYERIDPPEKRKNASSTHVFPSSLLRQKQKQKQDDEMDLSQRSRFAEARGRWSARGREAFTNPRSRSFDNSQATRHATKDRSRSLDNSSANEYAKTRRSKSKERSGAETMFQQRNMDNNNKNYPRSKSKEGSRSNEYADRNSTRNAKNARRSTSQERSDSNAFAAQKDNARRGRSQERSGANDYAAASGKGRPKSLERSGANAFAAQKDNTRRGRSQERSGANDYAAASGKGRPKSLERSGANAFAAKRGDERKQKTIGSGSKAAPKNRSRSFDASKAKDHADRTRGSTGGGGTPKVRSRSFDSSKANDYANTRSSDRKVPSNNKNNRTATPVPSKAALPKPKPKPSTTITKNPDGSVIVLRRRKREDGATVTTKTKYANIALARKHGIAV